MLISVGVVILTESSFTARFAEGLKPVLFCFVLIELD